MRPLSLEFEGFTAFRTNQRIDLSKLGLFTITGPTGSGKTSILDAMTYALYGEVPRVKKKELKQLVSHGLAEARIQFDFSADGTTYRVARKLPRKAQASAILERREGEDWVAEVLGGGLSAVNDRIEELVKLDYAAFTKAVLLPQGQFSQFLKGEPQERRDILIRLLDLDRYVRAGRRARAGAQELETAIGAVVGVLESQFADATSKALSELDGLVRSAEKAHRQFASVSAKVEEQVRELDHGLARRKLIADCRVQLEQSEEELALLTAACQELTRDDGATEATVTAAKKALDDAETQSKETEAALNEVLATVGDEGGIEKLSNALDQRRMAQTSIDALDEQLTAARTALAATQSRSKEANSAATKAKRSLEKAQKTFAEVSRSHVQATDAFARAEQRAQAEAAVEKAVSAISVAEKEQERLVNLVLSGGEEYDQAAGQLESLQREHAAVLLREDLKPGDSCPVCERPLEQHPPVEPDLAAALASAREDVTTKEEQRRRGEQEMAAQAERVLHWKKELAGAEAALAHIKRAPTVNEAQVALDAAKQKLETGERGKTDAEVAERTASENALTAQAAADQARHVAHEIERQRRDKENERRSAESVVALAFPDHEPADPVREVNNRREQLAAAREGCREANAAAAPARAAYQAAARDRQDFERRAAEIDVDVGAQRARLEMLFDQARAALQGLPRAPALPSAPATTGKRETRAGRLGRWATKLAAVADRAGAQLERLEVTLRGRIDDRLSGLDGDLTTLDSANLMQELRRRESNLSGQIKVASANVDAMRRRIEQRTELEEQIETDRNRARQLGWLATHLRADHFIGFVLQESLNVLALNASLRLREISDDRYSLLTRDGGFAVIDHANADEERSVNTLSGGETFLASLSLALALSTSVGELATAESAGANLDAVFIDEGFGALDPETLDDVVDALERLQAGELTVGVISHVPLLSQRIEEGLVVEKRSEGSVVSVR